MSVDNKRTRRDRNARVVDTTRRTIESLGVQWQDHNQNAVLAGGTDCLLYVIKTTGRFCTCGQHDQDVLDTSGNMSAENMQRILTGREVSVTQYAATEPAEIDVNDLLVNDDDLGLSFSDVDDPEPQNADYVPSAVDEMNAQLTNLESDVTYGGKRCAICFGTRFVGGFDLHNGMRIVLTHYDVTDGLMYTVRATDNPYRIDLLEAGAHVLFTATIPKTIGRLDALSIWDNDNLIPTGYQLYLGATPITQSNVHLLATGLPSVLRLVATAALSFTHLELQLGWAYSRIDTSTPTRQNNNLRLYDQSSVELTLPLLAAGRGLVGSIIAQDNNLWRITNVTENEDHVAQRRFVQVTARKVEPYEIHSLLPRKNTSRLSRKISHQPKYTNGGFL